MKRFLNACLYMVTTLALCSGPAYSQQASFPDKPIKIVVGSEAGSAPDVLARAIAKEMGSVLRQAVIVENKPGATGTIGAAAVAAAPADGYTLLMGTVSNIALAPTFYPIKYNPLTSFTPISMVASVPLMLVVSAETGITNMQQLRAKISESGSEPSYSYASPGVGGPQHIAGILLGKELRKKLLHVPYKSGGAALVGLAGGETQLSFAGIPAALPLLQTKKILPLFVTSKIRSSAAPSVPSATEVGLPDFDVDNWHALFAPAGLSQGVRSVLETAVAKSLQAPDLRKQFEQLGALPTASTGNDLASKVALETLRWSKIVKDSDAAKVN